MSTHIHTYIYTHTYIHTYIHTIYTCICTYTYLDTVFMMTIDIIIMFIFKVTSQFWLPATLSGMGLFIRINSGAIGVIYD